MSTFVNVKIVRFAVIVNKDRNNFVVQRFNHSAIQLQQLLQLPNRRKIFAIYAPTLLMFIVASPDPNPRGGGQLSNPNECNSTLTNATRGETLTPNPKSAILR